jgi:hypothetical protein
MAQVDFIGPDFVNRLDKSVPSAEGTPLISVICGLKPQGKAMEKLAAGEEARRLRINIRLTVGERRSAESSLNTYLRQRDLVDQIKSSLQRYAAPLTPPQFVRAVIGLEVGRRSRGKF